MFKGYQCTFVLFMYAEFKYKAWYIGFTFETTAATGGSCNWLVYSRSKYDRDEYSPLRVVQRIAWLNQYSHCPTIYNIYIYTHDMTHSYHATHAPSRHVIINIKLTGRYHSNIISWKRRYWENEENGVKLFSVEVLVKETALKVRTWKHCESWENTPRIQSDPQKIVNCYVMSKNSFSTISVFF